MWVPDPRESVAVAVAVAVVVVVRPAPLVLRSLPLLFANRRQSESCKTLDTISTRSDFIGVRTGEAKKATASPADFFMACFFFFFLENLLQKFRAKYC